MRKATYESNTISNADLGWTTSSAGYAKSATPSISCIATHKQGILINHLGLLHVCWLFGVFILVDCLPRNIITKRLNGSVSACVSVRACVRIWIIEAFVELDSTW